MHTVLSRNYFSNCKFWICSNSCPELKTDFLGWKLPWQMDEINFQIIILSPSINSKVLAIRPKTLFLRWQWNPKIVTHNYYLIFFYSGEENCVSAPLLHIFLITSHFQTTSVGDRVTAELSSIMEKLFPMNQSVKK